MTGRDTVMSDEEAGFGGHLRPGRKPAVVFVDFVRAYFEPGQQLYMGLDDCLGSAGRVLAAAREAGVLIVHTKVSFAAGGIDGGQFFRKVGALASFVGDTPAGEIMPQVRPDPGEPVLVKQYASAFFGTSLASTLQANGVDTLIITGVSTSGCVRATAVDALQHGFVPLVVRDAVGDRADGPHEANLYDIQAKYGEVVSERDVLGYLGSVSK
ncbi:isochorismatase [Subtercola sp. Z020]|uniref:isochorismatase family protein n=1 Tax=Subtercola sp. Z020 TaxID=2080582 RepID=UPI000CE741B0|nr:isochorismatase family protein [Subtercola sp. Z020]PPF85652.1 isochorismatase [Subtercola sp. Z020]